MTRLLALLLLCALCPLNAGAADLDHDGLDDAQERELAQVSSPRLIWSPREKCSEYQMFYQVHPTSAKTAVITYVMTFPVDCGYPLLKRGAHPGDTQELTVELEKREDRWVQVAYKLPWAPRILIKEGVRAPVYVSAGKHHLYPSIYACKKNVLGTLERCGGGPEEVAVILPEHDAGERDYPKLAHLTGYSQGPWSRGYAAETGWGNSAYGDGLFCGGDPKRGGLRSFRSKLKRVVAWNTCGEALGRKWK